MNVIINSKDFVLVFANFVIINCLRIIIIFSGVFRRIIRVRLIYVKVKFLI